MTDIEGRILKYYRQVDRSVSISRERGELMVNTCATDDISNLFAANAVYERDGWPAFVGKKDIEHFFHDTRALCGVHRVDGVHITPGIHVDAEARLHAHFPKLSGLGCKTLVVSGVFTGAQCQEEKRGAARFVRGASGVKIPFCDYWVFSGNSIMFRYSQMHATPETHQTQRSTNWERM